MTEMHTAADIMEKMMEDGTYPQLKRLQHVDKAVKGAVKKRLVDSEVKRHEFKKHGLVAKFVPKQISDLDTLALNEYLADIGFLIPAIKLDHKRIKENLFLHEQLQDFLLETEYFVKPSFNKLGNSLNKPQQLELDNEDINDLMGLYHPTRHDMKRLDEEYEGAKKRMFHCIELQRQRKLKHKYGSVSLIAKAPDYDINAIYKELGEDFLIEYGKPDSESIDKLILNGSITKKEVDQFKILKDIRLDFVLMTLESEEKMVKMLNDKTLKITNNRLRA